jgi:hypothetical protein
MISELISKGSSFAAKSCAIQSLMEGLKKYLNLGTIIEENLMDLLRST